MGIHTLNLEDGSQVQVEAPKDATLDELLLLANRQQRFQTPEPTRRRDEDIARRLAEAKAVPTPEPVIEDEETGLLGDLAAGFGTGFVGTGEMAALGAATLLGEESELAARNKIQGIADTLKPSGGDQDDLGYKIGSVFGSIAGFAAPIAGIAAGIAAAPISLGAAATTGIATGAGALLGVGTAAGEASERARAAGATQAERNRAIRQAAPFGLLEVAPLGRFMRSVDVPVINRLMDQLGPEAVDTIGQRISNAAVTGGAEAAQEATAEIVQNLAERGYNPERAILEGSGESAALGGGAGATIQFLVDAFTNSRKKGPDGQPQELLALPAPTEEELRVPAARQLQDSTSGEPIPQPAPPKLITGPDDLGVRLDSGEGQATTRKQRIEQAEVNREESAEQRGIASLLEEERLDRLRSEPVTPEEQTRRAELQRQRAVEEQTAAEDLELEQMLGEEMTQDASATVRKSKAAAIEQDLDARSIEQDAVQQQTELADMLAASELETLDAAQETKRQKQTDVRRTALLQETIADTPTNNYNTLTRAYERKLADQGISNTKPTTAETQTLRRAVDVQRAEQPQDVSSILRDEDFAGPKPKDETAEAYYAKQRVREPVQTSLAGMGTKAARSGKLGVAPPPSESALTPERQTVDGQMVLPLVEPVDIPIDISELTVPKGGKADVKNLDPKRGGAGPTSNRRGGADGRDGGVSSPRKPTTFDNGRMGPPVLGDGITGDGATLRSDTLESRSGKPFAGPDRPVTRQRIPGTKIRVNKQTLVAEGKPQFVKDPTLAPESVEEKTKQKFASQKSDTATKKRAETTKAKEADAKQAAIFEAQSDNVKRMGRELEDDTPSNMTAADKNKVLKELTAPVTKAKNRSASNALHRYFDFFPTFDSALTAVVEDHADGVRRDKDDNDYSGNLPQQVAAREFYLGSGKLNNMGYGEATKVVNWIRSNGSADLVADMEARIKASSQMSADIVNRQKNDISRQENAARVKAELKEDIARPTKRGATLAEQDAVLKRSTDAAKDLKLPAELVIDIPLRSSVINALGKDNLQEALVELQFTAGSRDTSRLAKRLAETLGDTKLVSRKNLRADDGAPVAGYFDPADNTIYLDKDTGFTGHALLHEALHAATSGIIANKSHPLTKKLNKLFEETKEQLAGEYGLSTMDEFVAEALSNPEFQTQLKITTVAGRNPWQQMVRAISNFVRTLLGRSTVPDSSAYQAIDELVQEMIAVDYDGRAATKMYLKIKTPAGAAQVINALGAKVIKADKNFYDTAKELMGSAIPSKAKRAFLSLQPVNILGQMAESKIPMAPQLNSIINSMSSALRERNERLDPIVDDLRKFRKSNPNKFLTLQSLVPNASHQRIDPRQADFDKAYGRDKNVEGYDENRAKAIHKELRNKWTTLGKEGQDLYAVLTNTFEANTSEVMASIDENLSATIKDATTRKKAIDKLAKLLNMERGVISPFAPLTRKGDFRLSYNTIDPETGAVELFTEYFLTEGLREKAKRNLKEYNDSVLAKLPKGDKRRAYILQGWEEGTASTVADFSKAPPDSFVFSVLEVLRTNGVDANTVDSIAELALDMMPERSFMQSFRKRGDVRGFLGDKTPTGMAEEAFDLIDMVQNKGRDYNRQIIQMKYGAKLQDFKNRLREFAPAKTSSTEVGLYRDKLEQIINFAQRPTVPRWSQVATSAGYAWTMGLNLSSAAITTFDVFMSTAPRLMGRYGDKATFKAMGAATMILARSPKEKMVQVMGPNGKMTNRKVNTGLAGFSIANYDFDAAGLPKELRDIEVLAEVATENAQINQTLNQEQLDMGNTKDVMEKINSWNSFLFHHAERYNREVAMTATYMLELQRMRDSKKGELTTVEKRQAAMTAVSETELTLGATASAGRPVAAQSGLGNMAMLFKRFAISKYYMMARMTDEAFKTVKTEDDKANRRIAQKQLGRFLVTTGLFAGVAGMPLMGALGQVYDFFVDDDEDDFDAMLRKTIGEGLYKGVVNEALGVEVASRISLNSLLYRPPIIEKEDQSQFFTLIEQLGGPIVGIGLSIERGVGLVQEGELLKGAEAILPAAARNVIKGGKQIATGDIETRRGDAVVEDIGVMQILGQFAGFANADVIKTYEINKNESRKKNYLRTERTRLLRAANIAAANGDPSGYREAIKKIREYNEALPKTARSKNIIMPDTIRKSRKAFQQRTRKMIGGIEYTPFMKRSLDEYDKGIQLFN